MNKNNSIIEILQELQIWIEDNCFKDETVVAIISRIQFEIKLQRQKGEKTKC